MAEAAAPQPVQRKGRRRLAWAAGLLLGLGGGLKALDLAYPLPLPTEADLSSLVLARNGEPLRAFAAPGGVWRLPTTPEAVSPLYLEALLGYEDRWFYQHPGVNPFAIARATAQALWHRRLVSGGSTLTMQVARLLAPVPRNGWGKLLQMLRALQLEWHLDKAQILTLYLNHAPFGGPIEGVAAASWAYLGKPPEALSHAEAALLAVLPQAPSRLRPDRFPEAAGRARDKVIQRLVSQGQWPAEVALEAAAEPVLARRLEPPMHAPLAARRLLREQGPQPLLRSTLDFELQRGLEERLATRIQRLPPGSSAAVLVVDNTDLSIRAYLGSADFQDDERAGHVDMVRAWRSPGSTLKPFLYGMALEQGLIHSESLLLDAPQDFGGYRPGNFQGDFHGPIGASEALRRSLNVPAVDLIDRLGPKRFAARLAGAGLPLRLPPGAEPGLSLILGGAAVRLEDLVGAFAALQRDGLGGRPRLHADADIHERRVLSPGAAWIVREMLAGQGRPGLGLARSDLRRSSHLAWKTGTSYGFRDSWAVGAGPRYTVGVWVGRPDGTPMPGHFGAETAAPLLFEIVDALPPEARSSLPRPRPDNVVEAEICWPLGLPPDAAEPGLCHQRYPALVLDGQIPPTLPERGAAAWQGLTYRLLRHRERGSRLLPGCHPDSAESERRARWPTLAEPWLSERQRRASLAPPLDPDCGSETPVTLEQPRIVGIDPGARLLKPGDRPGPIQVAPRALGTQGRILWLLNGRAHGSTEAAHPFHFSLNDPGDYALVALAGNGRYDRILFRVVE